MSFRDIKGQDRALEILKEVISHNRIFSSYLFVGPDGVGKFLAAKNFAKALNCSGEKKKDADLSAEAKHNKYLAKAEPCETCVPCRKINSQLHPDVFFIEPKGLSSSIGIDEIRNAIAQANLKPYEGRKKVFVINNAHSMNTEASNAFLKTLEEPPADTIFILVSRSKSLLLPTIVSRCHIIKFFTAPTELVERFVADRFGIGKDEAKILSNFSCGRIGGAIRMKEENLIDRKNRLIDSLLDVREDFLEGLGTYSSKEELKENLEFLLSFFRDIFLCRVIRDEAAIFNIDRIGEIKGHCKSLKPEKLDYLIKRIITLRSYIDYNVNPKIIVDVLANEVIKTLNSKP